jgi:hypothetical protein
MKTSSSSSNHIQLDEVKHRFELLVKTYHQAVINRKSQSDNYELEVKFGQDNFSEGNNTNVKITHHDYNNVIKVLKSLGFTYNLTGTKAGVDILRVQHVLDDKHDRNEEYDLTPTRSTRLEITGNYDIEQYCLKNTIKVVEPRVHLVRKTTIRLANDKKNGGEEKIIEPVVFRDFNFKASLKLEKEMHRSQGIYKILVEKYDDLNKTFRYLNRVTFVHPRYPVKIDISIVKSSPGIHLRPQRTFKSFRDADLLNQPESYEIEIELDNDKTVSMESENIIGLLRKVIKFVLSGLQETSYPISYLEQRDVLMAYLNLIHGDSLDITSKISSYHFIGYNPVTLQLKNVVNSLPTSTTIKATSIRTDYVVTDKADGERRLLFINDVGKVYMITTNMKVIFTGAITFEKTVFNSLLDGEYLIIYNTSNSSSLLYAAFDVYFCNKMDVRARPLVQMGNKPSENESRYQILQKLINVLKLCHVSMENPKNKAPGLVSPISVEYKIYYGINNETIFEACDQLCRARSRRYNTDGYIFTPASLGVGQDPDSSEPFVPSKNRFTWFKTFKWKPQEQTTIDFLVTTIKDSAQTDIVETLLEGDIMVKYKKVVLRCTFPRKKSGSINFCDDIVNGNLSKIKKEELGTPMPARFFPSNPYDEDAGIAYIRLHDGVNMSTVADDFSEIFYDNTIVEFKYVTDIDTPFHWVPTKVRHDKTIEMLQTKKYFGNAYHVANSNWESIHYPIKESMLRGEEEIPKIVPDEDTYYKATNGMNLTVGLKHFHNEIKRVLIACAAKQFKDPCLIDLAVGKGGDLRKWSATDIKFVLGIDLSADNLENPYDGACARYVKLCQDQEKNPRFKLKAMFVYGDCSKKIKPEHNNPKSDAMLGGRSNQIVQAVFGIGSKKAEDIGKGLAEVYGLGVQGYEISSCQFALHYFFERKETLFGFVSNLAECTKIGGYFIGTAYDGNKLFQRLGDISEEESVTLKEGDKLIWQVQKKYKHTTFQNDITCLGYKVTVFQESINNYVDEYLINFDYFDNIMAVFGFVKLSGDDLLSFNKSNDSSSSFQFNSSLDTFEDLYSTYDGEPMSPKEQSISFLNRCFIYKKNVTVNIKTALQSIEGYNEEDTKEDMLLPSRSDHDEDSAIPDSPIKIQEVMTLKSDIRSTKGKRKTVEATSRSSKKKTLV